MQMIHFVYLVIQTVGSKKFGSWSGCFKGLSLHFALLRLVKLCNKFVEHFITLRCVVNDVNTRIPKNSSHSRADHRHTRFCGTSVYTCDGARSIHRDAENVFAKIKGPNIWSAKAFNSKSDRVVIAPAGIAAVVNDWIEPGRFFKLIYLPRQVGPAFSD